MSAGHGAFKKVIQSGRTQIDGCTMKRLSRHPEQRRVARRPTLRGKFKVKTRVGTVELIPHDPALQPLCMRPDLVLRPVNNSTPTSENPP